MPIVPSTVRKTTAKARIIGAISREIHCDSLANIRGRRSIAPRSHIRLHMLPIGGGWFRSSYDCNLGARIKLLIDTTESVSLIGKANIHVREAFEQTINGRARIIYNGGAHPPEDFDYYLSGANSSIPAGEENPLVIAQDIQSISLSVDFDINYPDLGIIQWFATNNYGEDDGGDVTVWEDVSAIVNKENTHYVFKRFRRTDGEYKSILNQFGLRLHFRSLGATFQVYDYEVAFDYGGDPGGLAIGRSMSSRAFIYNRTHTVTSRSRANIIAKRTLTAKAMIGSMIGGIIGGSVLEGIQVNAYDGTGGFVGYDTSASDGTYLVYVPKIKPYRMVFSSWFFNLMAQLAGPPDIEYYSYWYDSKWSSGVADAILPPTTISPTLPVLDNANASISGTVLNFSGVAIPTAAVMVVDWATRTATAPAIMGATFTDGSGNYEVRGLQAGGTYAVMAIDFGGGIYDTVVYDAHIFQVGIPPNLSVAEAVTGGDTGIDFMLSETTSVTLNAQADISAISEQVLTSKAMLRGLTETVTLDAWANIFNLSLQDIDVKANVSRTSMYSLSARGSTWGGTYTLGAKAYLVGSGEMEYLLSGTLSGSTLNDVMVYVYDLSGNFVGMQMTRYGGYYEISRWYDQPLQSLGPYKIYFDMGYYNYNNATNYQSLWYGNKTSFEEATEVTAPATELDITVPHIPDVLGLSTITGTVTNSDETPLPLEGIMVGAIEADITTGGYIYPMTQMAITDVDGYYTIAGLDTQVDYFIVVEDWVNATYKGAVHAGITSSFSTASSPWENNLDYATPVSGGATGIDFVLHPRDLIDISGTITNSTSDPLTPNVRYYIKGDGIAYRLGDGNVDEYGVYTIIGLDKYDYYISFDTENYWGGGPPFYRTIWYTNASSIVTATAISNTTAVADVVLPTVTAGDATITGTVTGVSDEPLELAWVYAYNLWSNNQDDTNSYVITSVTQTDVNGEYILTGLDSNIAYAVVVIGNINNVPYKTASYGNIVAPVNDSYYYAQRIKNAAPIQGGSSSVDFKMEYAAINGIVYGTGLGFLGQITTTILDTNGNQLSEYNGLINNPVNTYGENGGYGFGVFDGLYLIHYSAAYYNAQVGGSDFVSEYSGGVTDIDSATLVIAPSISADITLPVIGASDTITGNVKDPTNANLLGCYVVAIDYDEKSKALIYVNMAMTGADGNYSITGLDHAVNYGVIAFKTGYHAQAYNGHDDTAHVWPTISTTTLCDAVAGDASGIDFKLTAWVS